MRSPATILPRILLPILCAAPLAGCHRSSPPAALASATTPVRTAVPLDAQAARDKVQALSNTQRQAFLADTRWASQARASRALLERAVNAGDKLDEKSMLTLDTDLRQAHHALAAAAGASFLEVLAAVQIDVFKTAEQRRAFETFVRKSHALRRPSAHDAARATAGKPHNELPAHA